MLHSNQISERQIVQERISSNLALDSGETISMQSGLQHTSNCGSDDGGIFCALLFSRPSMILRVIILKDC